MAATIEVLVCRDLAFAMLRFMVCPASLAAASMTATAMDIAWRANVSAWQTSEERLATKR
jgi:hypothetical protein